MLSYKTLALPTRLPKSHPQDILHASPPPSPVPATEALRNPQVSQQASLTIVKGGGQACLALDKGDVRASLAVDKGGVHPSPAIVESELKTRLCRTLLMPIHGRICG
ncbi:hypothetical protein GGX14DRAFT_406855 [Mycena pura]|uniref:Uncharacterized protein n=1 Tax=Mycena pura TaxID=153505 RepID=A0AAD6Y541_9AGAR|nr:hypothetical protein GGX14DRAFT_406855 [Mycena pura]